MKAREKPDRVIFIINLEIPMKSNTSTAPVAAQAIQGIPLNRLVLAPENVRKTAADRTANAELEVSIRAHGLLENLVVRPEGSNGRKKFAVIAGGRRLVALTAIAAAGNLKKTEPIPCLVVDIDFAKEVRPNADLLWSRLRKNHLLAIAGDTLGSKWAQDRAKFRLKASMRPPPASGGYRAGNATSTNPKNTFNEAAARERRIPGSLRMTHGPYIILQ